MAIETTKIEFTFQENGNGHIRVHGVERIRQGDEVFTGRAAAFGTQLENVQNMTFTRPDGSTFSGAQWQADCMLMAQAAQSQHEARERANAEAAERARQRKEVLDDQQKALAVEQQRAAADAEAEMAAVDREHAGRFTQG